MAELTQEQEDALILQELNIEDDKQDSNEEESETIQEDETDENSTINEDEDEATEEESESEEETQEEEEELEEPSKKPNKFAKLLSQRNEARKLAEEANNEKEQALTTAQELQAKLDKMDEDWEFGNEEYVNTLVEKKIAEREEVSDFFDEYDELKSHKKGILSYRKETGLNIEQATKLYLAETGPSLLLSPQAKAKQK